MPPIILRATRVISFHSVRGDNSIVGVAAKNKLLLGRTRAFIGLKIVAKPRQKSETVKRKSPATRPRPGFLNLGEYDRTRVY